MGAFVGWLLLFPVNVTLVGLLLTNASFVQGNVNGGSSRSQAPPGSPKTMPGNSWVATETTEH